MPVAPSNVLRLYLARLQSRLVLVQELFAVLGIAVGVALLFASQVASTTLNGSVQQLTHEIVGHMQFELEARGQDGFSVGALTEARRIVGVRASLPVLEQQATITGPRGSRAVVLIGTEPRLAHAGGPLLRRFSYAQLARQEALALPAPLATQLGAGPLQPVTLQIGANKIHTIAGASLQSSDIGTLVHNPIVLAPIAYAQVLSGHGDRITRMLVEAAPSRVAAVESRLRAIALKLHLNFEPATFASKLFGVAAAPTNQGTELFSAISALVGFLFAFNAILVTTHFRRTLVGQLRRLGTNRWMTIEVLLFDALVLGVIGCVVGLLLGDLLSLVLFHTNPGYLSFAFPIGSSRIVTATSVGLAVLAGLAASVIGVMIPLRDTFRTRNRRANTAARRVRPRPSQLSLPLGLFCLATTTVILLANVTTLAAAVLAIVSLVAALLLLLPRVFGLAVTLFARLQAELYSYATMLAATELETRANRARSLGIAATGAIAVFGSVAIGGAGKNLQHGLNRMARDTNGMTDVWISPSGSNNTLGTTAFPDPHPESLARLPGVASVSVYRGGFLNIGDRRVWVLAPPRTSSRPIPASQLVEGDLAEATTRIRGHGWAVLSKALATELHLRIGQRFLLPAPDPMIFRVAAISTNGGWPPGAVFINADDYASAWGSADASAYNVRLVRGASTAVVRHELVSALGRNSGLSVQTASQRRTEWEAASSRGLAQLTEIRILVIIAAVLAMAGAMSSMIWQRRPTLAYLKRQGIKRGVLWRALLFESTVLLSTGCLLGALFGLYGQVLQSHALASVTGFPVIIALGPLVALVSFALVCFVALAILAVPGYLAVRVRATMTAPVS